MVEEEESYEEEGEEGEGGMDRRRFIKLAVLGGAVAGAAALGGFALMNLGRGGGLKPWETAKGVVDYTKVKEGVFLTNELRIAQWYDYWPGAFITNFTDYIRDTYGRTIDLRIEIFTTNEELFTWITQSGRKFDLMFPSNYTAEIMEAAGLLCNMNTDWLPNLQNLADGVKTGYGGNKLGDFLTPQGTPYAFRGNGSRLAIPYQWGTTGVGYNTEVFTEAEIRDLGWEVFRTASWNGTSLVNRMGLLDDMREVIGAGMKQAGWDAQVDEGIAPTGIPANPAAPYDGRYQWTQNETSAARINASRDLVKNEFKPNLLGFNTQNQGPWLRDEQTYANQGWSGDIIFTIQPYSNTPYPVSYVIPKQGGALWIDSAVIHREATNLWLAHEFMNFFLDAYQGKVITDWNLYATPNLESYNNLATYPNGYDPRVDRRIYPTEADLLLCDFQRDVGVNATQNLYIPAWNQIKFG